jgi:hypothetical protein
MGDLATLAKRVEKLRKDLPDRVNNLTIEVAEQLVEQLVSSPPEGTPVDTSKAMSNWQVGVEQPKRSYLDAYAPGKHGSTFDISQSNVMVAALAALRSRKVGQVIYITNNAPYIRKLAYEGHSFQSPPGWVEAAVMNAGRFVQKLPGGRLLNA